MSKKKHPTFNEQKKLRWVLRNESSTGIMDRIEDLKEQEMKRGDIWNTFLLNTLLLCENNFSDEAKVKRIRAINMLKEIYDKENRFSCVGIMDDLEKLVFGGV